MIRQFPKQYRSFRAVDSITEAVIQLLDTESPKFTSNHVSECAGISVGTFYRYFPDKNTLLRYVVRRELGRITNNISNILQTTTALDGQTLLDEITEETLTVFNRRSRSTQNIRELVKKDAELLAETETLRWTTARKIHRKLNELEPNRFPEIPEAELIAVCEAFKAAVSTLYRMRPDTIFDKNKRSKLICALLDALTEPDAGGVD